MSDPMELLAAPFERGELPPAPPGMAVLRARPGGPFAPGAIVCEQGFRPDHDALAAAGHEVHRTWPDGRTAPAAGVALVRAKAENRANFARAWALTEPGGPVLAAGAKTDGAESLQKDLRKAGVLEGAIPLRHGRAIWATRTERAPEVFAEWLAAAAPQPRVSEGGRDFVTCAGAFCWDRVDSGSRLLVESLPELKGAVVDLGAGWGWLGAAILAQDAVARLDCVEAESAALACAEANLGHDPRAAFHWEDAMRVGTRADGPLPARSHDWVVMNPPFHEGRDVSLALGGNFLRAAARLLKGHGQVVLVANRTLAYERVLESLFAEVGELGRNSGYKVLHAARPRPRPRARPGSA